jgi:hypothetical protein
MKDQPLIYCLFEDSEEILILINEAYTLQASVNTLPDMEVAGWYSSNPVAGKGSKYVSSTRCLDFWMSSQKKWT